MRIGRYRRIRTGAGGTIDEREESRLGDGDRQDVCDECEDDEEYDLPDVAAIDDIHCLLENIHMHLKNIDVCERNLIQDDDPKVDRRYERRKKIEALEDTSLVDETPRGEDNLFIVHRDERTTIRQYRQKWRFSKSELEIKVSRRSIRIFSQKLFCN